jgi:RNA-directed DNA polymerase
MNSLQYKKNEFKKLCTTIGFKPSEVAQLVTKLNLYYREWAEQKIDKKTGDTKKYKDGTIKQRIIRPSLAELKVIQTNIKNKILSTISLPACVHGGVKRRSNISNAKPHQGNKYIFTTDLQEFYPNINFKNVYDTFIKLNYSPHYAHWLTKLTTWKHQLPQGTPTSTHIANLVFLDTDIQLIELCNRHGIIYTRYVDDLSFSSQQDFHHLLNDILNIITNNNFKVNYRKTKYSGTQNITGINVFLNKIDAPKEIIEKSKKEIDLQLDNKPYTIYLNNIRKTNRPKIKAI